MIHIITAVHNRYSITETFIEQLLGQTYKDIHLILVDDGSTDSTSEMVKEKMTDATIIQGDGNLWWGGALHKVYNWICEADLSDEDFVMFSNDDVNFSNDYLEKAVNRLKSVDSTLVTGLGISDTSGKIVDGPLIWDFKRVKGTLIGNSEKYGNCASTRSLFLRVKDLRKIGGFHPILLPHYASDYEWTIRACKKGYRVQAFHDLQYIVKDDSTGYRERKKMTLKQMMSKKSNANPVYRILFILLITPFKDMFSALLTQIKRILK